jgi:TolB-like protein/DNA-binding SARP family transcriptional activator
VNNVTTLTSNRANTARAEVQSKTRIYLLGIMRAMGPAGEDILPRPKKTQAVLAYLCLAQGERLLRSRLAGVIWDRSGETQARDSLRHALDELKRAGNWQLEIDHGTVRLDIRRCWIDAFETPDRPDLLLDSLYGISSSFDQWLIGERTRFENRWQTALENEFNDLVAKNAAPELRAAGARKLLNFAPTHEPAVRSLMAAFVQMDERAQAIREYERFRLVANTILGMPPSEKTTALYEAIRLDSRVRDARPSNRTWQRTDKVDAPTGEKDDPNKDDPNKAEARALAPERDLPPSVAVLPFRDLSGKAGRDHVAEGLTEDLVEGLSRVPSLFVVSRLSSAAFKNQDRLPREIGAALGVSYLLSGSIRVIGDRLRLSAELTDANTGIALWASRFDEGFCDLLDVQDRLAETVVGSVAPHVRSAELKRLRRKRPEDYNAYDLFLRAQEGMHSPSRETFENSKQFFEAAIAREPQYATALAWLAHWHVLRVGQGWSSDPAHDTAQADFFAERAVECDATESMAYAVQGHIAAYLHKDFDLAFSRFDAALRISPNSPRAWLWNAYAHAWFNQGAVAVEKVNRAMALSPYDPLVCAYSGGAGLAYMADGQYGRAIEFALRCMHENRAYTTAYKVLICSLVLWGREREARAPAHQLLMLEPAFTVQQFRRHSPAATGPLGELYCDAFATAGIPLSA